MIRVAGLLKIRQVAAHARGGSSLVLATCVASHAIQRCVHSRKRESRELRVIKAHTLPVVDGVAVLALGRKYRRNVVGRRRLLKRSLMAGVALNRQALELSHRFALVTVCAVQPGMTSDQREPVLVLFRALSDQAPALDGVTLFTVRSHLPAMNVSMAIGAIGPNVCKDWLGMTLGTGNRLVLAAQWILGRVVIEFRNRSNGLPSHRGVAVLARDAQAAVRASRD